MSFYDNLKNLVLGSKKKKFTPPPKPKPLQVKLYENYVASLNEIKVGDIDLVDKKKQKIVYYKLGKTWIEADVFINIFSFLSANSLLRSTEVSRHFFLAANTNYLWDALDGLYSYKTKQSKISFSQGRLDYRTRHKSIVLSPEEKEKFRRKLSKWEQDENFEKRSHVLDSDVENVQYAKDLVYGKLIRKFRKK